MIITHKNVISAANGLVSPVLPWQASEAKSTNKET